MDSTLECVEELQQSLVNFTCDKTAVVFGCTGQIGSYCVDLLLEKKYRVVGVVRRSSTVSTERLGAHLNSPNLILIDGDITDSGSVSSIINQYQPHECYNFAAQSFVAASFTTPAATFTSNTIGVINILEAIRNYSVNTKFYQSSTSEMFGNGVTSEGCKHFSSIDFYDEQSVFMPVSPYGVSKQASHELVKIYRGAYDLDVCSGIMFNSESPRRGEEFVTKKITKYVASVKRCLEEINYYSDDQDINTEYQLAEIINKIGYLELGNLDTMRDWGYAKDTAYASWLMLQQEGIFQDYVIATGHVHSLQEFLQYAFEYIGFAIGYQKLVKSVAKHCRPIDVGYLRGSSMKIYEDLGWKPTINFCKLIELMIDYDYNNIRIL